MSRALVRIPQNSYRTTNKLLLEHGFIIEDSTDEVLPYLNYYLGRLYESKSLNLTIATTLECNLHCPYCFEGTRKQNLKLTPEVSASILRFIRDKSKEKLHIVWFGGEPMLNFFAIEHISGSLIESGVFFDASLVTNGTIFPTRFIKQINRLRITSIQITLDGDKANHDSKRFYADGTGTFDVILSNIEKLLDQTSAKITVKINLDHTNFKSYPNLEKYLMQRFSSYSRLTVTHNFIRNRTDFRDNGTCMSEVEYFDYFYTPAQAARILSDFASPCPLRLDNHLVIKPNGDIVKCLEQLGMDCLPVGNICSNTLSIRAKSFYKLWKLPFSFNDCSKCRILPLCGGGCPMDIIKGGKPICSALKDRIESVVWDYYKSLHHE